MFITVNLGKLFKYLFLVAGCALLLYGISEATATSRAEAEAAMKTDEQEQILVIDPGHGGEDGGAVAPSGTKESDINLDIATRLQILAGFCGIPTVMTRDTDQIDYPDSAQTTAKRKAADQKARVELINRTPGSVLISIHQNKYPSTSPRGPQVLYANTPGSQQFGELTQTALTESLYPENRRTATLISEQIYLTKMVKCPAILVECGFLSNPSELALLETPEYRLKIATVLSACCMQYLNAPQEI